ncbi:sulfurtransferase TusA family protein [Roseomonas xinghualingensis]|uniref:sulfurtransferase TusA family protein n=1 Tax=Roseomonas xinghualingensis TaxID=2986475 RepID=UPI0021F1DFF2|nr:sulfurtransferase TusA family protein [Roseomonas sp. SXEYE001]MCV4208052.1 sulfurtransferase TusA family protein [Roseomonas sp. SXEYE001]
MAASPHPPKPAPKPETVLDVQGLTCPLPVLKANKALRSMPAGARLTVLATDAASVIDFQAFCRETGHALVSFSENAGVYRYTLRKRDDTAPAKGPAPR